MMAYLSSPYSSANRHTRHRRFRIVCRVAGRLIAQGQLVYSPIAHTHPIALLQQLPTEFSYWEAFDRAMITACSRFLVLTIQGWEESVGVCAEMRIARELGREIEFVEPIQDDYL